MFIPLYKNVAKKLNGLGADKMSNGSFCSVFFEK